MNSDTQDNWRYERKFRITSLTFEELVNYVHYNPFVFHEVFHSRYVNNIYLDTIDQRCFLDNVEGCSDRVKFRIRWYGDLFGEIHKSVLEIKIKRGLVGLKKAFPLQPFSLKQGFTTANLSTCLSQSSIPIYYQQCLLSMKPTLMNRYNRFYYLSNDGRYRITIDRYLSYFRFAKYENSFIFDHKEIGVSILELKYNREFDRYAHNVVQHFPFRATKNSKYVSGITYLQ